VITEYDPDAVRWQGDRPAAVDDLELGQPTRIAGAAPALWALYAVGDEVVVVHPGGALRGRAGDVAGRLRELAGDRGASDQDRQAAGSLLAFLGADDPGAAADVPRSQAETGPPAAYWLSDRRNAPPGSE
jgi:hypothetical protein